MYHLQRIGKATRTAERDLPFPPRRGKEVVRMLVLVLALALVRGRPLALGVGGNHGGVC